MSTDKNAGHIFELQKKGLRIFKAMPAAERSKQLLKLKDVIIKYRDDIKKALALDIERPGSGAELEIDMPIHAIDETVAQLEEWMRPVSYRSKVVDGRETEYSVRYEPRGVVLLFAPWNYPIHLLFTPLVAILAAGNSAIVKTNEMMPESSKVAAKIIREVFEEAQVAVFEGDIEVSNELLKLPIDHVFLTGSPRVGKIVMGAAAQHLASVTLELGGKCPAIIDDKYSLSKAAKIIAQAATYDIGQACQSVDYVALPEHRFDEFLDAMKRELESLFYVDGEFQFSRTSRFVNESNYRRVKGYLDDALARGASVALGGRAFEKRLVIEPTIIVDAPLDSDIMQHEIFGPVIPVWKYRDMNEVFDFIEENGKPLSMYVFADDDSFVEMVLENTSAGNTNVNSWFSTYQNTELPFGGVNKSGIGVYHGVHGFRELSNPRSFAVAKDLT
ncbi:aldehyde dehydrogenase family protein [Pseudomonas mandelii]|uniref:aldehyde dehydrogenase family protein n=1 Tax=Pseudomonas mandelii TaxID=75612 RepID=UPI0020A20B95|nr:aldehyde dehydrogenase family protein [Pseudomonas mandelii]MCO8310959.1 aldehyde dehydrogenase family protein [Pseudomonas mandelii]